MAKDSRSDDLEEFTAESIARGDPLLRILSRAEISPIVVGIAYVVLFNLLRGFSAWRVGLLQTSGSTVGFFDDPSVYTNIVALVVTVAYYVWMPRGIVNVFKKFEKNSVIGEPNSVTREKKGDEYNYTLFLADMQAWFDKWWWRAIILTVIVIAEFTLVLPQYLTIGQSAWWAFNTFNLVVSMLWSFVALYCVGNLLIYAALSIVWLSRLFRGFAARVRPLYPDHAGGLAPLGDFTLKQSYIAALVGIMLVVTPITRNYVVNRTIEFRWTTEILVGLGIYIVVVPIVFFATLSVAHKSMRKAKDQLLLRIARQFEFEYTNIQDALHPLNGSISKPKRGVEKIRQRLKITPRFFGGRTFSNREAIPRRSPRRLQALHDQDVSNSLSNDLPDLEQSLKTLEKLQALYDMTSRFPVWPFNISNLRRFGTSYLSPVVLAVLIDILSGLFKVAQESPPP